MIDVIRKRRAIVLAVCLLRTLAAANAQPANNSATNEAPEEVTSTNFSGLQPLESTNVYGAQPFPNAFEAQNNQAVMAGPSYLGSGQINSPIMGTGVFGVPGFAPSHGPGIYQAGLLDVHAGVGYLFLYGTGIEAVPGQHSNTVEQAVTPNVSIDLGTHWTLAYSAVVPFYSGNSSLADSVGQTVSLVGSTFYEDWVFGLSQGYSVSDTPLVETGTQTKQESYVTGLNVSRQLAGNFSFTGGLNQSFVIAEPFADVHDWGGNVALNYQFAPRLSIGLNLGGGYDEQSLSPAMTFESYQATLMLRPGPKTTVNLSGGIEDESFAAAGVPSTVSPIFSLSVNYQLLPRTSISIGAQRSVNPSFFANQVYTVTGLSASLRQQLTRKLTLSLTGAYDSSSYQGIQPGPLPQHFLGIPPTTSLQVTRDDVTTEIGVSLNYAFRPRWSGSVAYTYSDNSSSQDLFSYSSSQFTVQVNYRY
jgi:hypothetical protein